MRLIFLKISSETDNILDFCFDMQMKMQINENFPDETALILH